MLREAPDTEESIQLLQEEKSNLLLLTFRLKDNLS